MDALPRSTAARLMAVPLALGVGAAMAWQAWRVRDAARRGRLIAERTRPFQARPPQARARVLLLGDSTGVGVGAAQPEQSLPGLLAAEFGDVEIFNLCRNGARVGDVPAQIASLGAAPGRFDLLLLLVGGNDVLKLTPHGRLRRQARALLRQLPALAPRVVWMGSANLGASPLLMAPLAWCASWHTGRTMHLLSQEAASAGVHFIDFFKPRGEDVFARDTRTYFAGDGVHPSAASYRHCFEVLKQRTRLHDLLAGVHLAARAGRAGARPAPVLAAH